MNTRAFSWRTLYLRWAGLVSACLGLMAFSLLFFAFRENVPDRKLALAISSIIGIFISYVIGKDVMDRLRNHEVDADSMTNRQTQLAYISTRFSFALINIILLIALASILVFSTPVNERINFFCTDFRHLEGCIRDLLH